MKKLLKNKEGGAVVVEATIALTVFVFAIYTLLNIVNMCYIQSKIGSALGSSAKEISQFSFLYYKFGLDKAQGKLHADTADSRQSVEGTLGELDGMVDAIGVPVESFKDGSLSLDELKTAGQQLKDGTKNISDLYKGQFDDPKKFIIGMAKLAGEELAEEAKNALGQLLARAFMDKNLKESPTDDPNRLLKKYKVKDGINGLHFYGTSIMPYGTSSEIQVVCSYEIEVIKLLNIDYSFKITQVAKTNAWGNGVSKIISVETETKKPAGDKDETEGAESGTSSEDEKPMTPAEIIQAVKDGKIVLTTTKEKGNFGEMVQDEHFKSLGYQRLGPNPPVTSLDQTITQGIDSIYYKPGPPAKYIIADAKYGTSTLSTLADGTKQMSQKWIEDRLVDAVGKATAQKIINTGYDSVITKVTPEGVPSTKQLDKAANIVGDYKP